MTTSPADPASAAPEPHWGVQPDAPISDIADHRNGNGAIEAVDAPGSRGAVGEFRTAHDRQHHRGSSEPSRAGKHSPQQRDQGRNHGNRNRSTLCGSSAVFRGFIGEARIKVHEILCEAEAKAKQILAEATGEAQEIRRQAQHAACIDEDGSRAAVGNCWVYHCECRASQRARSSQRHADSGRPARHDRHRSWDEYVHSVHEPHLTENFASHFPESRQWFTVLYELVKSRLIQLLLRLVC